MFFAVIVTLQKQPPLVSADRNSASTASINTVKSDVPSLA